MTSDQLDLLTGSQVCEAFGISLRQLHRWRKLFAFPAPVGITEDGEICAYGLGHGQKVYYLRGDIEEWVAWQREAALEKAIARLKARFDAKPEVFAFCRKPQKGAAS